MESSYDRTTFDPSAIRGLAKAVAAETRATPVTHQQVEWYGKNNRQFRPVGPALTGWVIDTLIEESARDGQHGSWEAGWEFFLRKDGELMASNFWRTLPSPPRERSTYTFEPLSEDRMTYLDRPNRGDFVETSPGRQELQQHYVVEVPTKAAGLKTALVLSLVIALGVSTAADFYLAEGSNVLYVFGFLLASCTSSTNCHGAT